MAVVQTMTITDDSGKAHASSEALMDAFHADCTNDEEVVAKIEEATEAGTAVAEVELSEAGDMVTINRTWADAAWAEVKDMEHAEYTGWTVTHQTDE